MKSEAPVRVDLLPWRSIDGRAVILNPRAGEVHELDEVGTFLWSRADGGRILDELALELSDEFDVDAETALSDSREFFETLASSGLIRWSGTSLP